ncbi:hypothetical protein ACOSP7_026615 [Xanthoceras sorbifolium]
MAVRWVMTLTMTIMVWKILIGCVSSCFTLVDELATSIRTGDIPISSSVIFIIGKIGKSSSYEFEWKLFKFIIQVYFNF